MGMQDKTWGAIETTDMKLGVTLWISIGTDGPVGKAQGAEP